MLISLLLLVITGVGPRSQQPEDVVRQLYRYVVAHRPLGIPTGDDKAAIWPLLSRNLIQQLETARACEDDYRQQHGHDDGKPSIPWLESGLFSGSDEEALPSEVTVERIEPQEDGSFRICVQFTYKESFETHDRPPDASATFHWRGAVIVKSDDGRFAIDDILIFKGMSAKLESRLSRAFTGCSGPRWVGDRL